MKAMTRGESTSLPRSAEEAPLGEVQGAPTVLKIGSKLVCAKMATSDPNRLLTGRILL
jgi:hypothetical protein